MTDVFGWDIGGVNTKLARVADGRVLYVSGRPYEVQRAPDALSTLLQEMATEAMSRSVGQPGAHVVTMTAELSQLFRTKREGVSFVLDAVEKAFPSAVVRVWTVDGRFVEIDRARLMPLDVAAANWSATAHSIAKHHPDALLLDIGTTTSDIIPVVGGVVVSVGRTDPERLASGELVYTGALRTPAEAIVSLLPLGGRNVGVSAEGFALAGDAHVWRGDLDPADYTCPTPDGRPAAREFAGERLARVICADREMLDAATISSIADAMTRAQVARIGDGIKQALARNPSIETAVITGLGSFLGEAAARRAGLRVLPLARELGEAAARCAPAASVALLFEEAKSESLRPRLIDRHSTGDSSGQRPAMVDVVVKLGGGVLAHSEYFDAALAALATAGQARRLLVVPGGGPFADAVRAVDRQQRLSDDAAHWMAILAMDQLAHLIASRLACAQLVSTKGEVLAAERGRVMVLAPSQWLREADPLPHSWDVTSDSIAAWVAGALGVRHLVLIKPPNASGADLVDAYYLRALPEHVTPMIVTVDRMDRLHAALRDEAQRG
jgi:(4-(4-[2-(gamma-L-glutamylamino)ethyl]phenoxymethyl)furan-2-yl)methanamine synthase